jgi:hypothetical protein
MKINNEIMKNIETNQYFRYAESKLHLLSHCVRSIQQSHV